MNRHVVDQGATELAGGVGAPPWLHVSGPDGRRVGVELSSPAHSVGELADALSLPRRARLLVDDRVVDRRTRLDRAGVVQGSRIGVAPVRSTCRHRPAITLLGGAPAQSTDDDAAVVSVVVVVSVAVEAGPGAGRVTPLGAGRHVIGRASSASVRLDDGLVEVHHATIEVAADVGADELAVFTQLAGRVPCRVLPAAGDGAGGVTSAGEAVALAPGSALTVGASRLRLLPAGDANPEWPRPAALAPLPGDPWRSTLHRRPRPVRRWDPHPIEPPAGDPAPLPRSMAGLVTAVLSMAGGAAMALALRQPMFLAFSALGFVVAAGSFLSGRFSDHRVRRRDAAESRRDRERFAEEVAHQQHARRVHQLATAPTVTAAVRTATTLDADLWVRRSAHDDAFTVSLGWGTLPWRAAVAGEPGDRDGLALSSDSEAVVERTATLADVPVTVDLGPGRTVAVVGHHAVAVARAVVLQLAAFTGPADWRLVVVADDIEDWGWCGWLPHATLAGDASFGPLVVAADDTARLATVLARLDDGDGRHVVVLTDRPELLSTRTGAVRRFLGAAPSAAVLAIGHPGAVVPSVCHSVLEVGSLCTGRWCADTAAAGGPAPVPVHAAGVTVDVADAVARSLARVHDPEDPDEAAGAIPSTVPLSRLLERCGHGAVDDAISIAARWQAGRSEVAVRIGAAGGPRAAIGVTADGVVEIDLVDDGPHALVAGTTGAGKSELLRTFVATFAATSSPDELTFVLVDYKGGSTFDACADLPHTVGVVTDLDDRLAERALVSLEAEIRRRERLLRAAGADDLASFRTAPGAQPLPRLVVVVDEFAALAAELPVFLSSLVGVAQRGRSLGIHLVLATQRPAGVVSDDIRANTNLRIALRLQDRADAVDIVGVDDPASFPRGIPGRAMLRLGPGETVAFQAAHSSGPHRPVSRGIRISGSGAGAGQPVSGPEVGAGAPSELEVLSRSVRAAASLCEIRPPHRPWLPPLPERLDAGALVGLGAGAVGLVDDPATQSQGALRWERERGNLALIGSLGSGTSTALRAVVVAAGVAPHVYVIDARGDGVLDDLSTRTNCGAVIGLHDTERRGRLIRMLGEELGRRQGDPGAGRTPVILAVDGLGALLTALGGPADADDHARLVRVLADGPGTGIHTVSTFERPGAVAHSALAALGQRWVFHLDDPVEAVTVGLRAGDVPAKIPGRLVVADSRLEAQVAQLDAVDEGNDPASCAPAVGTLAEDIDARTLPRSVAAGGATSLTVGVDFASLAATAIDVADGEHVLVAGPARSGRSTALMRAIVAWRDAHPDALVVVHAGRRSSPLPALATGSIADVLVATDVEALIAAAGDGDRRVLVAVDDAELVDDPGGRLLALVTGRAAHLNVVAAGRPDALRSLYGHWTAAVRRSRLGLIMSAGGDADGDILGDVLPRRVPLPPRPGLAWLIDGAGRRLVQVARDHLGRG